MCEIKENKKVTNSLLNACRLASSIKEDKIELLPHNQMLYDKIVKEIEAGERSIFYSQATGLGKSFIFMRLVQDYFMDKKILYIVPKIAIWNNLISYSDFNKLNKDNIEMATYTSFNKYNDGIIDKYDVVFVDECHHMLSDIQGTNICKLCINMCALGKYVFGLTATPYYKGTYVDCKLFDVSCYGYDILEAIELGILPKIHFAVANLELSDIPLDVKQRYSIVGTKSMLQQLLDKHKDKTKWLAYFLNKSELEENANQLRKLFPGYKILKLYVGSEDEKDIIQEFNTCEDKVILMSVNKLLEGVHLKGVQGVLLYRNVTEASTYMQMYGRLCDINAKSSPVFLDVSNAIFSLRGVSENIFKSSRCNSLRKSFCVRDYFDVHSEDYWTIEVYDILKSINSNSWSEEEDNIMLAEYLERGIAIRDKLPNRSNNAIYNRAMVLGLVRNPPITDEEKSKLARLYESRKYGSIVEMLRTEFPGRSPSMLYKALREMGYDTGDLRKYKEEEVELASKMIAEGFEIHDILKEINNLQVLKDIGIVRSINGFTDFLVNEKYFPIPESDKKLLEVYYPIEGNDVFKRLSKNYLQCQKTRMLRLYGGKVITKWTKEEDAILTENYEKMGLSVSTLISGRTPEACGMRAKQLGLAKLKRWTKEEDSIIKANLDKSNTYIASLLDGRTAGQVGYRKSRLGLTVKAVWLDEEITLFKEKKLQGLSHIDIAKELNELDCNKSRRVQRNEVSIGALSYKLRKSELITNE